MSGVKSSYKRYREIENAVSLIVDDILIIYGIKERGNSHLTYKSWNYSDNLLKIVFVRPDGGEANYKIKLRHLDDASSLRGYDFFKLKENWLQSYHEE